MLISSQVIHICRFHSCDSESLIVTGFGKMCIVHTSDFVHMEIYKNTGDNIYI